MMYRGAGCLLPALAWTIIGFVLIAIGRYEDLPLLAQACFGLSIIIFFGLLANTHRLRP
jgi:hypothetical protein